MSVIRWVELIDRGRQDRAGQPGKTPLTIRLSRTFAARTDPGDTETTVLDYASCPRLGDSHPDYAPSIVIDRRARAMNGSRTDWLVTISYSTQWDQSPQSDPDPTNWPDPLRYRIRTEYVQVPFTRDVMTGDALLNSARDPYDPPLMRDVPVMVVEAEKVSLAFPSWIKRLVGSVNNAAMTILGWAVAVGEARLVTVDITGPHVSAGVQYWLTSLTVQIREGGFRPQILDAGLNEIAPDGSKRPILYKGQPITRPVPLDGAGRPINPALLPAGAVYSAPANNPERDFSPLGLPP